MLRDLGGTASFGFTWTLDGGEATISDVHESIRALGLIPGAKVLAIDDQMLGKLTPEARCRRRRSSELVDVVGPEAEVDPRPRPGREVEAAVAVDLTDQHLDAVLAGWQQMQAVPTTGAGE